MDMVEGSPNVTVGISSGNAELNSTCVDGINNTLNYIIYSLCGGAVIIFVLYSFLQKRKRCAHSFCCGVPSVIVPIDLIHSSPHRMVYVFIFGAISGHMLFLLFQDDLQFTQEGVSSVAGATGSSISVTFIAALMYFPLFASVNAPLPLLGYILGVLYAILMFSQFFGEFVVVALSCVPAGQGAINFILGLVSSLPVLLCQLIVVLWFLWSIGKELYRLCKRRTTPLLTAIFEHKESCYHTKRVRWLLVPPEKVKVAAMDGGKYDNFKTKFIDSLFKWNPHIQYPLRFLSAMIIMMNIIWVLTFSFIGFFIEIVAPWLEAIPDASDEVEAVAEFLAQQENFGTNLSQFVIVGYSIINDAAVGLLVVLPIAPLLSYIACVGLLIHMVAQIHIHIRKLSKGDLSFISQPIPSPAYRLVHAMVYPGYQTAFFIWAWILLTVILWLAGVVLLLFYYLFKFFPQETGYTVISLTVPLIYSLIIYYIQLLLTKLFFVGDTHNKHTVINNLRWYHFVTYVLYFQNIVVGITSALLRVLYAIAFGLLLLFRLDRVVLMKGFEKFDSGHKKYIGFLYVEYSLNNAVLNVFCKELLKVVEEDDTYFSEDDSTSVDNNNSEKLVQKEYPRVSKRARNRWLVAYTLIRNEALQDLTASKLIQRSELHQGKSNSEHCSTIVVSEQENSSLHEGQENQVLVSFVSEGDQENEVLVESDPEGSQENHVLVDAHTSASQENQGCITFTEDDQENEVLIESDPEGSQENRALVDAHTSASQENQGSITVTEDDQENVVADEKGSTQCYDLRDADAEDRQEGQVLAMDDRDDSTQKLIIEVELATRGDIDAKGDESEDDSATSL